MLIETLDARIFTQTEAQEIGALLAKVWPKPDKPAAFRAQKMLAIANGYAGSDAQAPRSFVIREAGKLIAHAAIVPRTIGTTSGDMTIAGLAQVCTDPDQRGRDLGKLITRAAFELVDSGAFHFSLFQTSPQVRPFYEKLGSCLVDNPIVNSLGVGVEASPFWDSVAMRYPSSGDWPQGEIDLRGPGY
jgi:predicted N-acetyltransferase YhbS